jgi:hypothetical protein
MPPLAPVTTATRPDRLGTSAAVHREVVMVAPRPVGDLIDDQNLIVVKISGQVKVSWP